MKKLFYRLWEKAKTFLLWLWHECKDWRTLVIFGAVCAILGFPVWGFALLGLIFSWEWAYIVAGAMWGIWMLPGMPFFALSLSITLGIKRIYEKKQEDGEERGSESSSPEESECPDDINTRLDTSEE